MNDLYWEYRSYIAIAIIIILAMVFMVAIVHGLSPFTNKTVHDCIVQFFGEDSERIEIENYTIDCKKVLG